MKTMLKRGIIGCCMFLLLYGCGIGDDGCLPSSDKVKLMLDVASAADMNVRSGGTEIPDAELIHTLRVVILDTDGTVEHNLLVNTDGGVQSVDHLVFEVRKNSAKTIYLLANAEQLPGLDLSTPDGLEERILDYRLTLDYITSADCLPMSSSYSFSVHDKNKDCGTLYVAYAATKFTFAFENQMRSGGRLGVSGITVNQISSTSYLYPRGDDRWLSKLMNHNVVTSYEMPDEAEHHPFSMEDFQRVIIENAGSYTFPAVYLTESRNIGGSGLKQSYSLGLKIGKGEDGESDYVRDVELVQDGKILSSLFRSTHVKVRIIVKDLQDIEVIIGIYGAIEGWEDLESVPGIIEEE